MKHMKMKIASASLISLTLFSACGINEPSSDTKVTKVNAYRTERQTIGNCWIYAQASWLESIIEREEERVNISESYWTYMDWSDTLYNARTVDDVATFEEVDGKKTASFGTGGRFETSRSIIQRYGYLEEVEFNPSEQNLDHSPLQKRAVDKIQADLLDPNSEVAKLIALPRTTATKAEKTEKIRQYLDKIFEIQPALDQEQALLPEKVQEAVEVGKSKRTALIDKAIKKMRATEVYIDKDRSKTQSVSSYLNEWVLYGFDGPSTLNGVYTEAMKAEQKAVFKNVMLALNDHVPVLMAFQVHFNALEKNFEEGRGGFTFEELTRNPSDDPHDIGGHMIMLSDYSSSVQSEGADGEPAGVKTFGYGNLKDPEEKAKAANGDVISFVAKNSWGFWRPERGMFEGKTELLVDYLLNPAKQTVTEDGEVSPSLSYFVIPKSYAYAVPK